MQAAVWRKIVAGVLLGAPAVLFLPAATAAQAQSAPSLSSAAASQVSFRILDQDRILRESRLGMWILTAIQQAEQALDQENEEIAAQLAAEEQELTEQRASLSLEEFRARADAFDVRVEAVREERSQRAQEQNRASEIELQGFYNAALPVLERLMLDERITVLMRPDVMILGPEWLDITPLAIERLDAAFPHLPDLPAPSPLLPEQP